MKINFVINKNGDHLNSIAAMGKIINSCKRKNIDQDCALEISEITIRCEDEIMLAIDLNDTVSCTNIHNENKLYSIENIEYNFIENFTDLSMIEK